MTSTTRMPSTTQAFSLLLAVALIALMGCAARTAPPTSSPLAIIRERTAAQFHHAFYLKPSAGNRAPELIQQLAPLLIIEAPEPNATPDWPGPGVRPQIFYRTESTILNGNAHGQLTFWWEYPRPVRRNPRSLAAQGVRITLDASGRPIIWEVLADTSGVRVIYVSENLEGRAVQEFGGPVAGRRFAIEPALSESPDVVVARVLADGPMPMGPIIYLRGDTHDVTTVLCRCMNSQARELTAQLEYELMQEPSRAGKMPKLNDISQGLRLPKVL